MVGRGSRIATVRCAARTDASHFVLLPCHRGVIVAWYRGEWEEQAYIWFGSVRDPA